MRHSVRTMLVAMAIGVSICGLLPSEPRAQDRTDARFDLSALQGICTSVRARNSTRYEQQLQSAAGVRPDFDSESEARAKISALFASNMPICEGFNVGRGSVLKYAVAARASDFLYAAANIWNVDLNRPEADGTYLLDYLVRELARFEGRSGWNELEAYRVMLIRAGARTTAQLEAGEGCRPSTRCRR